MARNPRDPNGYYDVLNISPGANSAEVQLAYTFLKNAWQKRRGLPRGRIKEAYECLSDPDTKRDYDEKARRGGGAAPERVRLIASIVLAVVLLAFGGFVFPGFLLPAPEPFELGDQVVSRVDAEPLGRVMKIEIGHRFPNGGVGDAYQLQLSQGGQAWFPTGDLERNYR